MNTTRKIGRITVAISLVGFGLALLLGNLGVTVGSVSFIARFWPVMLIGFGIEYLVYHFLPAENERKLRFDWGGAIVLALIVGISLGVNAVQNFVWHRGGAITLPIGPSASRSESRAVSAAGARELVVDVAVGSVHVQPAANANEVRVEAEYTIHGINFGTESAESRLSDIQLIVTEGETVKVSSSLPGGLSNLSIAYTIYAPQGLKVQAHTGAGRIDVTGYDGDMDLTSNVGRLTVSAGKGSLRLNSGSGSVTVQDHEGPVTARTNVGSLEVRNVTGALQLDSGTGSITVREFTAGQLVAETRTGRIDVSTGATLEGNVSLKTRTGSVNLSLPRESSIRATAQTSTGSLNMPSFMSENRQGTGSSAVGTSGDGKFTVSLEASTGGVTFTTR